MGSKTKLRRRRGARKDEVVREKGDLVNGDASTADALKYRPHKSLLIVLTEETPSWYDCGRHTPGRDDTIFSDPPSSGENSSKLAERYRTEADEIYQTEVQLFSANNGADQKWIETTMKRGTLKDRIASMSVVVNTNPFHKLYALDSLLQLAGCSAEGSVQTNSRVSQMAAEALADLFENTLLPSHRKLYTLEQRPLYRYLSKNSNKTLSPRVLLLWRFEELIKTRYQLFVQHYLSESLLREGMELVKVFALRTCGSLLRSVPEGEEQLLSIMVNKLGDPSKKVAACAGHELRRVLDQHENMQLVIAREVQQLSYRPHLSPRALYNCIIFLNQLKLVREDEHADTENTAKEKSKTKVSKTANLPASLINTYFRLFEVAVNQANKSKSTSGMKSRLLSALLTGVNRAHPYLPDKDKHMEEHIDALYRIVHTAPPSACTQALMLLFHLAVGSEGEIENEASHEQTSRKDRFYRALYASLAQRSLLSSGKHLTLFFNLLYKSFKYDTDSLRVVAMSKRLLCTTITCTAPVVAASLFLLNEVLKFHPALRSSLEDVARGSNATAVLDPTKREPRAALVSEDSGDDSNDQPSAPLWEVSLTSHHFHPSVAKFASTLGDISYTGDPLRDLGLAPFLDKFAYRNPKSPKSIAQHWKRGESVAERRSGTSGEIEALMSLPVNDPAFIAREDHNEQEEFFQKFFVERARRDEIKGIVRGKGALGELDSDNENEEEQRAFDEAEAQELDHNFDDEIETDSEEEAFVHSLAEKLMESSGHGKANYDDEDPDMEGWGDLDYDVNEKDTDIVADSDESGNRDDEDDVDDEESTTGDLALVAGSETSDEEVAGNTDMIKSEDGSGGFVDASEYEAIIEKSWKERKRPAVYSGDMGDEIDKERKEGSKRTKRGER